MSTDCRGPEPRITVTLTRAGEQPLVLPPECENDEGLWWNALTLPDNTLRYAYAPPSQWVPGQYLLGAVQDASTVTMQVAARSASSLGLIAWKAYLADVLSQFTYTLSIGIADDPDDPDNVLITDQWQAMPTLPKWGVLTPQRARAHVAEATFAIPVNPTGAP